MREYTCLILSKEDMSELGKRVNPDLEDIQSNHFPINIRDQFRKADLSIYLDDFNKINILKNRLGFTGIYSNE